MYPAMSSPRAIVSVCLDRLGRLAPRVLMVIPAFPATWDLWGRLASPGPRATKGRPDIAFCPTASIDEVPSSNSNNNNSIGGQLLRKWLTIMATPK